MTCIAVKIGKKKIEIAGDSQASYGSYKFPRKDYTDKQVKSEGKIFQVNDMTIGCAGTLSHIGMLRVYAKTHKPKEMERDAILDWFIEFREWFNKKTQLLVTDISIHGILINEGKVFTFYDFVDCGEVKEFDSIGSGMFLALGAMDHGANVTDAIKTAIKYDLYCGGEVTKITIDL